MITEDRGVSHVKRGDGEQLERSPQVLSGVGVALSEPGVIDQAQHLRLDPLDRRWKAPPPLLELPGIGGQLILCVPIAVVVGEADQALRFEVVQD